MAVLPKYTCDIDTIKELLSIGWNYCTPECIVQYPENYVYDDDPNHPESHKAGEIRSYNFWWVPDSDLMSNMLPYINIDDAHIFLLRAYNIHIMTSLTVDNEGNNAWLYKLQVIKNKTYYPIAGKTFDYTYADCMLNGIKHAIKYIKENGLKQIDG